MATSTASQYGSVEDIKGKAKQSFDDASDRAQEIAGQARQQVGEVAGKPLEATLLHHPKGLAATRVLLAGAHRKVPGEQQQRKDDA